MDAKYDMMTPVTPNPNIKQHNKSRILDTITVKSSINTLYFITLKPLKILMMIVDNTVNGSVNENSLTYIIKSGLLNRETDINSENKNIPMAIIIPLIVTNLRLKEIAPLIFALLSCPIKIGTNLKTP